MYRSIMYKSRTIQYSFIVHAFVRTFTAAKTTNSSPLPEKAVDTGRISTIALLETCTLRRRIHHHRPSCSNPTQDAFLTMKSRLRCPLPRP